ncbi:hypothetical protein BXU11_10775 [Flavobacterium sp. LM5]|uniref:YceI family protein n=1 Tax=Flavobacterium sp. LM5 TaxID=1938610 RepID=UPI000993BCAE|nr:YceI family protein [Flavobacterium sp. LM5]OOV26853.1 hypothetical protein BXU11_10775 [Flavobacterium sp. LM5]
MTKNTLIFLCMFSLLAQAQNEWSTTKGSIHFEASVPFFEEIKATNNEVSCSVILTTNEINCTVYIQQFRFKLPLMQQHFNENYLESDRYPKASFIGRIEKLNYESLTEKPNEYTIKGIIKIHGKSKPVFCKAWIDKSNNGLSLSTTFILNTEDFNIKIPVIITSKISKQVSTTLKVTLTE